jgi:hypothetical protein
MMATLVLVLALLLTLGTVLIAGVLATKYEVGPESFFEQLVTPLENQGRLGRSARAVEDRR